MGTRAGDCNGGGIAGDLSGWGPFGEDFRLFDSDGRKIVLGRWAVGAEVERPLGICCCEMNGAFPTRSREFHSPTLCFVPLRNQPLFPPFPFLRFLVQRSRDAREGSLLLPGERCAARGAAPPRVGRPFSCRSLAGLELRRTIGGCAAGGRFCCGSEALRPGGSGLVAASPAPRPTSHSFIEIGRRSPGAPPADATRPLAPAVRSRWRCACRLAASSAGCCACAATPARSAARPRSLGARRGPARRQAHHSVAAHC